ncbi:MAG: ParB N-terminal domain-containing protein [Anaerolineales bacterium]|nr:MAG: ParB N-terminal domain-containing protein [Anaerolineales bacterium]
MSSLPTLRIVPSPDLVPHEWHDDQRSQPLIERLRASGVLRNPPMVTPLPDGSGRYMVLDGANRTSALNHMGIPHALVQVVEADYEGLDLHTWNHVLWDWDGAEFLQALRSLPDVTLKDIDPGVRRPQTRWPIKTLVWVQTRDGKAHIARSVPGDLASRTQALNKIAELYAKQAVVDRTTAQQVRELHGKYDNLTAIVVYPPFKVSEVLELCAAGVLLPPGITRFTVSPRALRVNYSLDELSANKSLEEKNEALQRWVNERTARKGVRYYAEPTVLYDE